MLSLLDLKRVKKFEITADRKERRSVLLTVENEDSELTIEIDLKPHFKQLIKEDIIR